MSEPTEYKEEPNYEIECSKRPEVVKETFEHLQISFEKLGIEDWKIPEDIEIVFRKPESGSKPLLGRVEIEKNKPVIIYDERFSTKEGEEKYTQELQQSKHSDYPGMIEETGTLKHELAHIIMWGITGIERQPSIKMLDEGFANLVQETTKQGLPKGKFKKEIKEGLQGKERENFEIALDFEKPIPEGKNLNTADSKAGTALLMWIHETKGVKAMIELITKSPSTSKNSKAFQPVELDQRHKHKKEYDEILQSVKRGEVTMEEAKEKGNQWVTKQFCTALEEVTGKDIVTIKKEFLDWIKRE